MYIPETLEIWTRPNDWFGTEWPDYYVFIGRNRDSSILDNTNFSEALKAIGGETETVVVVRENHWAVGWIEWIAIHNSDSKALQVADEIAAALTEYPIVCEEAYSQAQHDAISDAWENCGIVKRIERCRDASVSIFAARKDDTIPRPVYDMMVDSERFI